jgi:hypothetical protein
MKDCHLNHRREFLRQSAAGAVGLIAGQSVLNRTFAATTGWATGMQINDSIDNLRVVCCNDSAMIKSDVTNWTFANQNSAVDKARLQSNMDEMAKTLAQKSTAADAWAAIFRKPASKQWSQVKAAIKVNTINQAIMPRAAVIGKICTVLNTLGVPYSSIVIYDGNSHYSNYAYLYSNYSGGDIPAGVVVSRYNDSLSGIISTPVPDGFGNHNCTANIANGAIDILVNCTVNKGHDSFSGGCTLSMKNHFGTFSADDHSSVGYITAINKSDAIVGGTPARQQLCIVDALWSSVTGPNDPPSHRIDRLIMGTFGGAVDYLVVKKIRGTIMGATHNNAAIQRFMTDFGFTSTQFSTLDLVTVSPAGTSSAVQSSIDKKEIGLSIILQNGFYQSAQASLRLPYTGSPIFIEIFDSRGRLIRELQPSRWAERDLMIVWNGCSNTGLRAPAGTYVIRAMSAQAFSTGSLLLAR